MKSPFKHLQLLTLGVFLLLSTSVFAAANECYSLNELNDFKALYIKLQQELNYEGKDSYLDKNSQVQLKAHDPSAPYPGKEFEAALFSEYQNSLRKIGKLYQAAKFDGDDSFKSNELLVNFMKAIDEKSSESTDFINKTKIKDVLNALEEASKKKYGASDKKSVITAGDKYLLEKLLTHAQDRICSVSKFEETGKGTALFKADYLQKVKNAPLNLLVNTIKASPIGKDSKIDLKESSPLTANLVDPTTAINSAITDNLNQLSAWVKKVKSRGPKCLAAIKTKTFANKIQGQIQGCNFGHFMETLDADNVDNLEAVLHFINSNEKLLAQGSPKAETSLDELKLEGFVSKTFDNLGTQIRCTQLEAADSSDKKVFIRNLPYDEKNNKFDTTSIQCKAKNKILSADACKKQYELISDSLGRGLEIKPKKGGTANVSFSIKETDNCSDISFSDPATPNIAKTQQACNAQLKDGAVFIWDAKTNKCSEVALADVSSSEQCLALKKNGFDFQWDNKTSSCRVLPIMSAITENKMKTVCEAKIKIGISFKWNTDNKSCDEAPMSQQISDAVSANEQKSLEACVAKKKDGFKYQWNKNNKACDEIIALSADEQKSLLACESKTKDGFQFKWNTDKKSCDELPALSLAEKQLKQICENKQVNGSTFKWDNQSKKCLEQGSILLAATGDEKQFKQACESKMKEGYAFKWNALSKACDEAPALSALQLKSRQMCEAQSTHGNTFRWDVQNSKCIEGGPILLVASDVSEKQAAQACYTKSSPGVTYKWNSVSKACENLTEIAAHQKKSQIIPGQVSEKQAHQACENKTASGVAFKWNAVEKHCDRMPASSNNNGIVLKTDEPKNPNKIPTAPPVGQRPPSIPDSNNSDVTPPSTPDQTNPKQPDLNNVTPNFTHESDNLPGTKVNCEDQKKEGFEYKWMQDSLKCIEVPAEETTPETKAQLDCEANKKEGFEYKWFSDSSKCIETPMDKPTCEAKKKDGFTYSWDADKSVCNEVAAKTEDTAEDKALAEAEKKCEADNDKWVEEKNEGRPGIKWEWDGKTCVDTRKSKDTAKKGGKEAPAEQAEPESAPKRAPARFVPINIPSRQIYLMPGMP